MQKSDALVFGKILINLPRFLLRHHVRAHDVTIGDEPEKTHLRDAAKRHAARFNFRKPFFCQLVMNVAVGCQRNPDVDVRQAGFQFRRWSAKVISVSWT